jgi:hypothetical protein
MLSSTIHNGAIPISGDGDGCGALYFIGREHDQAGKLLDTHCHIYALLSYSLALYLCCLEDKLSGAIEKEWTER